MEEGSDGGPRKLTRADSRKMRRYLSSVQRMVDAARSGSEQELSEVLSIYPGSVTAAVEPDSRTALHSACLAGHAGCVRLLLNAGAVVERAHCLNHA